MNLDNSNLDLVSYSDSTDREVAELKPDFFSKKGELLLTCYFTSKSNPQSIRDNPNKDSIDYIRPWYESVNRLGLRGLVLHDGLSKDFTEKYTTECVNFVHCVLGSHSLNDERFILYHLLITKYRKFLKAVFMTDGNDVRIQHDPFSYISRFKESIIFVGRNNGNRIRHSPFNLSKFRPFEKSSGIRIENEFMHQALYNAGILGGRVNEVVNFLEQISKILLKCKTGNNNMLVFNYVLFKYWNSNANSRWNRFLGLWMSPSFYGVIKRLKYNRITKRFVDLSPSHRSYNDHLGNRKKIHTSGPLCSPFKKYSTDSRYIFIHK